MKKTLGISALLGLMLCSSLLARNETTWDHKFYIHINDKKYVTPKSDGNNYRWVSTGNISILSQRSWECQIQATSRVGDGTLKIYDPYDNGLCESIDVQVVELKFKEKPDQYYGFYENLSAPSDSTRYYKSVKLDDQDTLTAYFRDPIVDGKFTMYLSPSTGVSSTLNITENDQQVLIQSKSGTGPKSIYYKGSFSGSPTLGTLNAYVYKERPMNVRVIPVKLNGDSSAPNPGRFNAGDYVKKTFNQVCFNTTFGIESAVSVNMSISDFKNHLDLIRLENALDPIINRQPNDICVLLIYNIARVPGVPNPLGFVRTEGSKYAYLVTENSPSGGMSWQNTIAHEIGHCLGLKHVSMSEGDNLMIEFSASKNKLNKDQWQLIGKK